MTALRVFWQRAWSLVAHRDLDARLDDEIQTHLDFLADEHKRRGMSDEAARAAARRDFGGVASIAEATRDARGFPSLASWVQDVRYALRQLRRQPGFAAAAILTLAIGIGASTGIFSVVDVVLIRPLPYPDADRLVTLHEQLPGRAVPIAAVSPTDADVWRQATTSFEGIGLLSSVGVILTGRGESEELAADSVSPSVLTLVGAQAEIGRLFVEGEDVPGRERVVILGHDLWQRRFNGDRSVIGTSIDLNGQPHEIVGVLAPGISPPQSMRLYGGAGRAPQLWRPLALTAAQRPAIGNYSYAALAKLKPGVTLERARAELDGVQANLTRSVPGKGDVRAAIVTLQDQIAGRSRDGLRLLGAAVLAVLIVGCANIVNLLLARSLVRRREMAVRQALGAGRGRLVRQLLVENLTLCTLGGACGLLVGFWVMRFLVANAPADVPRLDEVALDGRVLLFTAAASVVATLIIGILPAWRLRDVALIDAMTTRGGGASTRTTGRLRSLLVSSQIGVSMACLVVAGLLAQSFARLLRVDRGFRETSLLTLELNLSNQRYADSQTRTAFVDQLIAISRATPGVVSAAAATRLPLTGTGANSAISRVGTTLPVPERPLSDYRSVSPEYFQTIGVPLESGRLFTAADRGRYVAVMSANLAAQAWPDEDPLGQHFRFGSNPASPLFEVIGIVGDVRNRSLDQAPTQTAYVPYPQGSGPVAALLVNVSGDTAPIAQRLREALRALDPDVPVPPLRMLDEVVDDSLLLRRFQLDLVVFFAMVAALLTVVGVYGLMAYAVAQRQNEFGVRLALGEGPRGLQRLVMRQATLLTLGGILVAVPFTLAAGSALQALLFGVTARDPLTFAIVGVLVTVAALAAAYFPARRASRIQPTVALRCE